MILLGRQMRRRQSESGPRILAGSCRNVEQKAAAQREQKDSWVSQATHNAPRYGRGIPPCFFVTADSKEVKKKGVVTAEYEGLKVRLESADTKGSRKC